MGGGNLDIQITASYQTVIGPSSVWLLDIRNTSGSMVNVTAIAYCVAT